jgi:MoxR-like ATPase
LKYSHPAGYQPGTDLVAAVNVALLLRKPLLLTGRPGTGKTELGHYLAWKMGYEVFQFDAKSTSVARDLFYVYDAIGHYRGGADADIQEYLSFQALGTAILRCADRSGPSEQELKSESEDARKMRETHDAICGRILKNFGSTPQQSVVVIDEIDKAPRDFPNDLLNEIDKWYFHIPEWRNVKIKAIREKTPILVITSNSEKNLPAAFLRRCVYCDIAFPEKEEALQEILKKILSARLDELTAAQPVPDTPLAKSAAVTFSALVKETSGLKQPPGTAEFIDWVRAMLFSGANANTDLRNDPNAAELMKATIHCLVKSVDDARRVRELLGIPVS